MLTAHHQEVLLCKYSNWHISCVYVECLLAGFRSCQQTVNTRHDIYQLLYLQSSTSWLWAV